MYNLITQANEGKNTSKGEMKMKDDIFNNENSDQENSAKNDHTSDEDMYRLNEFSKEYPYEREEAEKYDTERFYTNEEYRRDKVQSYSYYDNNFDREETSYYRDNLDSSDVEEIVEEKLKNKKTPFWKYLLSAMVGGLIVGGGFLLYFNWYEIDNQNLRSSTESVVISPTTDTNVEVAVNQKASDSVVGITTLTQRPENLFFGGSAYAEGVGSGVIVSEDGYILTNSHVVQNGDAKDINVVFRNKETVPAELIWYEPQMDLAVIKVEGESLTPIEVGDSDEIKVGDKAIAIGNPLGLDLQSTLTSGYISGLDRSLTMRDGSTMDGLIQTDAAINSGNSGGALLNAQGQLIGINTAKAQGGDGLGFAIPINTATTILNRVESSDSFEPVLLGIRGVDLSFYESYTGQDLGADNGIVVMEVEPGSPASNAGLEAGDIISAIDGRPIGSMGQLRTELLAYSLGDSASISVIRGSLEQDLTVSFVGQSS